MTEIQIDSLDQPNTPPIQPLPQNPHSRRSYIPLFILLGLGSIAGSIFLGMEIGKNQAINRLPAESSAQREATPTVFPTINPTMNSTPTIFQTSITSSQTATPTPNYLAITYTDKEFGYSISYNNSWEFRRTYGSDIQKLAPTDILSGIDLHKGGLSDIQAVIVITILDAHGLTDIDQWITNYDLNYPKEATKERATFNGNSSVIYRYLMESNNEAETWYFIRNNKVYKITFHEPGTVSQETRALVKSFIAK